MGHYLKVTWQSGCVGILKSFSLSSNRGVAIPDQVRDGGALFGYLMLDEDSAKT